MAGSFILLTCLGLLLCFYALFKVTKKIHTHPPMEKSMPASEHMLSVVAHDLRSPISSIAMASQLIEEMCSNKEVEVKQMLEYAHMISGAASQAHNLISLLLEYGKTRSGKISINKTEIPLSTLLSDIKNVFLPTSIEKNIVFCIDRPGEDFVLICDRPRMLQALSNLLNNAMKFTPAGGQVRLAVFRNRGKVRFEVHDTGCGISTHSLGKIFDIYWQAPDTAALGSGLGLSICRSIVDGHSGKIWVTSEKEKGSCFFIEIPDAAANFPYPCRPLDSPNFRHV